MQDRLNKILAALTLAISRPPPESFRTFLLTPEHYLRHMLDKSEVLLKSFCPAGGWSNVGPFTTPNLGIKYTKCYFSHNQMIIHYTTTAICIICYSGLHNTAKPAE